MTPKSKTRHPLTPRRARAALALAIPALALAACTTTSPNDARWYASTAVTQPHLHATDQPQPTAPILPGTLAATSPRFWDARRDAQLGQASQGPATAATQWPIQPRPNEQIFRFRTLKRN